MGCFVDQTGLDEITLSIPIVQLIITFLWPAISSTRGNRLKNIHYRPIKLMAPLSSKVIMQLICSIRANHPNWTQYKSGRTGHHYRLPTLNHQPWFLSKIPEPRVTIRLESIYSLHCNKKIRRQDSGCGTVGRAVASNTRDRLFESQLWEKIICQLFTTEKTKTKKKEARIGPFKKIRSQARSHFSVSSLLN